MGLRRAKPPYVPGLNKSLVVQDLEESRNIYNVLPDDAQQPHVPDSHISNLAAIFVRNHAEGVLGIHLAHAHFAVPEHTVIVGVNHDKPHYRWAKTTAIQTIDLSNMHGHIFVLTEHGFHPYEYQEGPAPDLSGISGNFLTEFADYLIENNLTSVIGLQVLDYTPTNMSMMELILPLATIMLDAAAAKGCVPTRQTGWKFEAEDGNPRTCKFNETHGTHARGHLVCNEGALIPKLTSFQDVENLLVAVGIL